MTGRLEIHIWILLSTTVLHAIWAALLLLSQDAHLVTPMWQLRDLIHNHWAMGLIYLASTLLAFVAILAPRLYHAKRFGLLLPQQLLMIFSAESALRAMLLRHYADGVERTATFIGSDQLPLLLLVIWHTLALLLLVRTPNE